MTKPGYTHIIVPIDLHRRLKEEAERRGLSISKLVRLLLEHGINTSINTLGEREKLENCLFSKKMVARGRFELPSAGPKPAMLVRYTTGLRKFNRLSDLRNKCLFFLVMF